MVDALAAMVLLGLAIYAVEAGYVWRAVRTPVVAINLVLAPFWTILGALPILMSKLQRAAEPATYLEKVLFPIVPNRTYFLTLVAYLVFLWLYPIVIYLGAKLIAGQGSPGVQQWHQYASRYSHSVLLAELIVLMSATVAIVGRAQSQSGGVSLYVSGDVPLERLVNYLLVAITVGVVVGLTLAMCDKRSGSKGARSTWWIAAYSIIVAALVYVNWLLGRRNLMIVLVVGVAVGWYVVAKSPVIERGSVHGQWTSTRSARGRWLWPALGAGALLVASSVAGVSRGSDTGKDFSSQMMAYLQGLGNTSMLLDTVTKQSEWFASHMSLYGVIDSRIVWQGELGLPYALYTEGIAAPSGAGYTIHQVAAWWIYVGPFAPVIAAVVVGTATVLVWTLSLRPPKSPWAFAAIPAGTLGAVAVPAALLRGGPEGIWGLILMFLVLPLIILAPPAWATRRKVRETH